MYRTTWLVALFSLAMHPWSIANETRGKPQPLFELPNGAVLRLGSRDFRTTGSGELFVLPDGKHAVTTRIDGVDQWSLESGRRVASVELIPPAKLGTTLRGCSVGLDGKSVTLLRSGEVLRFSLPLKDPPTVLPALGDGETIRSTAAGAKGSAVYAFTTKGRLVRWKPDDKEWTERSTGLSTISWPAAGGGLLVFASARERDAIRVWDTNTEKELAKLEIRDLKTLTVSPDGRLLVSSSGPSGKAPLIQIWDLKTSKVLSSYESYGIQLGYAPAFSPDGTLIAHGTGRAGYVVTHEVKTGKQLNLLTVLAGFWLRQHFLPDGTLITMGKPGVIEFWNVQTGKRFRETAGHTDHLRAVVYAPGGGWITAGDDGTIRRWDATGKETGRIGEHEREVVALAISADGKTLFGANRNGVVRSWDVAKGTELQRNDDALKVGQGISGLTLSPDGKTLAAANTYSVRLHDAGTLKQTAVVSSEAKSIPLVAVSFLGNQRLVATNASSLQIWDVPTGNVSYRLDRGQQIGGSHSWGALAGSTNAKQFVTQLNDPRPGKDQPVYLGLWDADTGKLSDRIEIGKQGNTTLTAVAYLPDGTGVVVGDASGKVWVVDVVKQEVRRKFEGHRGAVTCVAVAPDGKSVTTGGADTTALIWDLTK